jgi:cysteine desulfurase/selenocysteine lyase
MLNIEKLRNDTPGCHQVVHFNNAGASLMPSKVSDRMKTHLDLESAVGGYEAADMVADELDGTYSSIAKLLQCDPQEVAIVENATRGWDMAFYSINFKAGDKILTGISEYASNYIAFLQIAKRHGVKIEVIPNDETGQLSLQALEQKIDKQVKLIAVTHVPTNGGLVNPANEIGELAAKNDILYLLDTCQSLGQMPIHPKEIGCNILTGTGRKFLRGPRGTGFMYVDLKTATKLEPPFLDLHAATWTSKNSYEIRKDAKRFENWESNIAAKLGLKIAIDYLLELDVEVVWDRISKLAKHFREKLSDIKGVTVHDLGKVQCGIVTFTVDRFKADEIRDTLRKNKINVSVSLLEYARLDLEARQLPSLVRASVHYFNTEKEIEIFCDFISKLTSRSRT